ncbi:MAG TPA: hypothetical protein PKA00_10910 [Saprospiraceae bacterium]|nr:hypothetical protein [Saprospiraceae bacterium]HMQ83412.1 hypothetical protein [Saprospiraceae bacterium]
MKAQRLLELFLVETILYILLWLWDDYLASLLSLVFGAIIVLILLVSLIVEWIEPSKVPRWYFVLMLISIAAPLVAALLFAFIGGGPNWMYEI